MSKAKNPWETKNGKRVLGIIGDTHWFGPEPERTAIHRDAAIRWLLGDPLERTVTLSWSNHLRLAFYCQLKDQFDEVVDEALGGSLDHALIKLVLAVEKEIRRSK